VTQPSARQTQATKNSGNPIVMVSQEHPELLEVIEIDTKKESASSNVVALEVNGGEKYIRVEGVVAPVAEDKAHHSTAVLKRSSSQINSDIPSGTKLAPSALRPKMSAKTISASARPTKVNPLPQESSSPSVKAENVDTPRVKVRMNRQSITPSQQCPKIVKAVTTPSPAKRRRRSVVGQKSPAAKLAIDLTNDDDLDFLG
jgi:hypothetical protein